MIRNTLRAAAIGLATTTLIPGMAIAQERPSGTYVGIGAGANFAEDTETGLGANSDISQDTGHIGVLSLGHAFGNGLRGEIEFGTRRNSVDSVGNTATGGRVGAHTAMLNGFYDFATGTAFIPYIGGGIGIARASIDADPVGGTSIHDAGWGMALQGIAGVGYQIDKSLVGTLEYRYLAVNGANMNATNGASVDADLASHAVMVGLRYTFGAEEKPMPEPKPAPMPVAEKKPEPAPAPAPPEPAPIARTYLVFFDWDAATITPEAEAILRSAAENAKKGNVTRIQATGHADRSGTQTYNLRLSERRAKAVQKVLNNLGIATDEIATDWKGELEPLVPTDDGVREPQNRRVEILFP